MQSRDQTFLTPGRTQLLLGSLAVFLLALALYGSTLRLPLIYDSLLHIRITKGLDWLSVWVPTEAFGFYRPFTFVPLLIVKGIWGTYPAPLLHGINVLTHAINGVLLLWLSWRLWGRPLQAVLSGVLFVVFPFSYQAVTVYGHNVHPAITNLILIGLLLYLAALQNYRGQRRLWWILTALVAFKAILTHESAVLFGVFAGLIHIQATGEGDLLADIRRQFSYLGEASLRLFRANLPWLLLLLTGISYLFIYQFFPLSRAPQAVTSAGGSLGFKMMYVGQAIAQPLVALFFRFDLMGPIAMVVVGFMLTLLLSFYSSRWPENRWPLFTGWVWFVLAALLVALPLPTGYLLNGPRLLYLSSVGIALIWPWLLQPLWQHSRRLGGPIWLLLLLAIAVSNIIFVRQRLDAYAYLTSPIPLVGEILAERSDEDGVMLINLPSWIAPPGKSYPSGAEFVVMMGDYLFAEELVEANVPGENRPVWAGAVRDIQRDPDYGYTVHAQSSTEGLAMDWAGADAHVVINYYEDEGVVPRYTGRYSPVDAEPLVTMGPYTLSAVSAHQCGTVVAVSSTWQAHGAISPTTTLFVQLLDENGQLLSQADGPPLGLRPDLVTVVAGWSLIDQRTLPLNEGIATTVLVGAYDFTTGTRFEARTRADDPLPDNAFRVPVQPCTQ